MKEKLKEEILLQAKKLREGLQSNSSEILNVLDELKNKVKELNNEQIEKKFNGIESWIKNEDMSNGENLNKALEYIEFFEKSVDKNFANPKEDTPLSLLEKAIKSKDEEKIGLYTYICVDNWMTESSIREKVLASKLLLMYESLTSAESLNDAVLTPALNEIEELKKMVELADEKLKELYNPKLYSTSEIKDTLNKFKSSIKDKNETKTALLGALLVEKTSSLGKIKGNLLNKEYENIYSSLYETIENLKDAKEEDINKAIADLDEIEKLVDIENEEEFLNAYYKIKPKNIENELKDILNALNKAVDLKNKNKMKEHLVQFIEKTESLNKSDRDMLLSLLTPILTKLKDADNNLSNVSEETLKEVLSIIKNVEEAIDKRFKNNNSIPKTLPEIRKEMKEILGKSLLEGIEEESEYSSSYKLNEEQIKEFQELRNELKHELNNSTTNQEKIDDIRMSMFILLGIDPFTYGKNKELIDNLDESKKERFSMLKEKHNELIEKQKSDKKAKINAEVDSIRKRMAEILSKKGREIKPYEGIENINEHAIEWELDENEKDEFQELRERLNYLLGKGPKPSPKPNPIPPKTGKSTKKRRKVKFFKKAKDFYKKHKKIILLVAGIAILAAAAYALLPSVMYLNSCMWWEAIFAGASPEAGLPVLLNDINKIIGAKIGATYASSGVWTLANGVVLNEGVKTASMLAAVGKLALTIGGVGTGATLAIKNAVSLATEKIKNRKNKKKKEYPKDKKEYFKGLKNNFKKGKEMFKSKFSSIKSKKTKSSDLDDKIEEEFYRKDLGDSTNELVNYLIEKGVIDDKTAKELDELPKKKCLEKITEIFNNYRKKGEKTSPKPINKFYREDLPKDINEFIQYAQDTGLFDEERIERLKNLPTENAKDLIEFIESSEKFKEYKIMMEETKREGKGSK